MNACAAIAFRSIFTTDSPSVSSLQTLDCVNRRLYFGVERSDSTRPNRKRRFICFIDHLFWPKKSASSPPVWRVLSGIRECGKCLRWKCFNRNGKYTRIDWEKDSFSDRWWGFVSLLFFIIHFALLFLILLIEKLHSHQYQAHPAHARSTRLSILVLCVQFSILILFFIHVDGCLPPSARVCMRPYVCVCMCVCAFGISSVYNFVQLVRMKV